MEEIYICKLAHIKTKKKGVVKVFLRLSRYHKKTMLLHIYDTERSPNQIVIERDCFIYSAMTFMAKVIIVNNFEISI